LLDHAPVAGVGDEECVQVKIVAILDCRTVDFRDQAAAVHQRVGVQAGSFANLQQLGRGLSRVTAAAAANMNAQFPLHRREPALQGADHTGGDAGGVPVHAHHSAK